MENVYIISGVTGMTGSELASVLVSQGKTVVGFDNFFASCIDSVRSVVDSPLFTFYEYDINNKSQMESIKEEARSYKEKGYSLVYVNCAAVVHTEHFYHVNSTFETNVLGMRDFLSQAIEVGAEIFINCSTSEVYSMNSHVEGGVKESDFLMLANAEHSQRTSYAAGKLMTEFFLKDAVDEGKIKGCSIRFANVYSNSELYPKHIIPHILRELKEKGKVTLLENSKVNKRTFLHNTDSCMAVICLINNKEALDGTVYNVATTEEISIVDLVYLCAEKMGIEKPEIIFEGYRASDPERRVLNTDKIRSATGWEPHTVLSKGIEMCIERL